MGKRKSKKRSVAATNVSVAPSVSSVRAKLDAEKEWFKVVLTIARNVDDGKPCIVASFKESQPNTHVDLLSTIGVPYHLEDCGIILAEEEGLESLEPRERQRGLSGESTLRDEIWGKLGEEVTFWRKRYDEVLGESIATEKDGTLQGESRTKALMRAAEVVADTKRYVTALGDLIRRFGKEADGDTALHAVLSYWRNDRGESRTGEEERWAIHTAQKMRAAQLEEKLKETILLRSIEGGKCDNTTIGPIVKALVIADECRDNTNLEHKDSSERFDGLAWRYLPAIPFLRTAAWGEKSVEVPSVLEVGPGPSGESDRKWTIESTVVRKGKAADIRPNIGLIISTKTGESVHSILSEAPWVKAISPDKEETPSANAASVDHEQYCGPRLGDNACRTHLSKTIALYDRYAKSQAGIQDALKSKLAKLTNINDQNLLDEVKGLARGGRDIAKSLAAITAATSSHWNTILAQWSAQKQLIEENVASLEGDSRLHKLAKEWLKIASGSTHPGKYHRFALALGDSQKVDTPSLIPFGLDDNDLSTHKAEVLMLESEIAKEEITSDQARDHFRERLRDESGMQECPEVYGDFIEAAREALRQQAALSPSDSCLNDTGDVGIRPTIMPHPSATAVPAEGEPQSTASVSTEKLEGWSTVEKKRYMKPVSPSTSKRKGGSSMVAGSRQQYRGPKESSSTGGSATQDSSASTPFQDVPPLAKRVSWGQIPRWTASGLVLSPGTTMTEYPPGTVSSGLGGDVARSTTDPSELEDADVSSTQSDCIRSPAQMLESLSAVRGESALATLDIGATAGESQLPAEIFMNEESAVRVLKLAINPSISSFQAMTALNFLTKKQDYASWEDRFKRHKWQSLTSGDDLAESLEDYGVRKGFVFLPEASEEGGAEALLTE